MLAPDVEAACTVVVVELCEADRVNIGVSSVLTCGPSDILASVPSLITVASIMQLSLDLVPTIM